MTSLLIAGVSTRAAAESAARAGFDVTAIDAFADLDQHPGVTPIRPSGGYSVQSVLACAQRVRCDAVAYLAAFENYPDAVAELAHGRVLLGNFPDVLRRARNPRLAIDAFRAAGHRVPRTLEVGTTPPGGEPGRQWLLKPVGQGGGHGVRDWRLGGAVPPTSYLQEKIPGPAGSVVFVAAREQAAVLGVFSQLIGEDAFGASGYRYCGNVLQSGNAGPTGIWTAAEDLASTATRAFGLVGVNGIDFVVSGDDLYPVEIKPRWTASAELVGLALGVPVFGVHAVTCEGGVLPESAHPRLPGTDVVGKAIVFARREVTVADTGAWLGMEAPYRIRDIPPAGTTIGAGRPVCTVFANAPTEKACRARLEAAAGAVYSQLEEWGRRR